MGHVALRRLGLESNRAVAYLDVGGRCAVPIREYGTGPVRLHRILIPPPCYARFNLLDRAARREHPQTPAREPRA